MRFYLIVASLFIASWASAQTIQYYTPAGEPTLDISLARTFTKTITTDSLRANVKIYTVEGKLETEKNYSNLRKKVLDGEFKTWYKDGQLANESVYKNGKLEGSLKTYHQNGKLKRDDFYKEGKLIKGKCFTIAGTDTAYYAFEITPKFPGGDKALLKFIRNNLKYPKEAQKSKIQGLVVVNFVVDRDGSIDQIKILKSVRADLDQEVIRLVNSLPTWIPAQQEGINVKTLFTLPVRFSIN